MNKQEVDSRERAFTVFSRRATGKPNIPQWTGSKPGSQRWLWLNSVDHRAKQKDITVTKKPVEKREFNGGRREIERVGVRVVRTISACTNLSNKQQKILHKTDTQELLSKDSLMKYNEGTLKVSRWVQICLWNTVRRKWCFSLVTARLSLLWQP